MKAKQYRLAELAELTQSQVHGNADTIISSVASLQRAKSGQLSFSNDLSHREALQNTQASAVILTQDQLELCKTNALITAHPQVCFAKIAQLFVKAPVPIPGIHPKAIVADSAKIAATASVGPAAIIGENVIVGEGSIIEPGVVLGDGVEIGNACHLHANVSVGYGVKIGSEVIIHSGVVIGADGFGMAHDQDGSWLKFPQLGSVVIGNQVEIGANTCIDRGALEDTVIEDGVKLDNLIQVAHNVRIGAHTVIAGCVAIAGSVTIGRYCMIGGASTINGHISICDKVAIGGTSSILKSITEPGFYMSGFPAVPDKEWKKLLIRFFQLDKMMDRLKSLEKDKGDKV